MFAFNKFTLARQFIVASFLVFLAKTIIVGSWAGQQLEIRDLGGVATAASLSVGSLITPHLQNLPPAQPLETEQTAVLDHFAALSLQDEQLLGVNLWGPEGVMLYSTAPQFASQQLTLTDQIKRAFAGEANTEIYEVEQPNNPYQATVGAELLKSYVPILAHETGQPIAVLELFQTSDTIVPDIRAAQLHRWLEAGLMMTCFFLLLTVFVVWSNRTMSAQHADLEKTVLELQKSLAHNKHLTDQVRGAAGRTTALNEKFLSRISADLHDGPGQDIGLALLRLEPLLKQCPHSLSSDIYTIQTALESAMTELRTISAGLRLPHINDLSPLATTHRAIRDYERKTNCPVGLEVGNVPENMPVPVKITLYRLVQEALSNGYRHAAGEGQVVRLDQGSCDLNLEVVDCGPGFNPAAVPTNNGRLGLVGMCDRVKILGGHFEIQSVQGQGTTVKACLPLVIPEVSHV